MPASKRQSSSYELWMVTMHYNLKSYDNLRQLFLDDEPSARLLNNELGLINFEELIEDSHRDGYSWGDGCLLVFDDVSD